MPKAKYHRRPDAPAIVDEYTKDPLLTPSEVANAFRVDPKTVTRWAKVGRFGKVGEGHITTLGGHRRYRRSWVNRALEGHGLPKTTIEVPVLAEIEDH